MTNYGFLITAILALIVLLVALVFITLAYFENGKVISDAIASGNTSFMKDAESVSTFLLIAVFIGWAFFILTITYVIIAFIQGSFKLPAMKGFFKKKKLSDDELLEFVNDVHETSSNKRNIIIGFVELGATTLIAIVISILAVLASVKIGSVAVSTNTPAVQSKALIGGLVGLAAAALTITSIFFLKKEYNDVTKLAKDSKDYMASNITTEKYKTTEQKLSSDKELQHKIKEEANNIHDDNDSVVTTKNTTSPTIKSTTTSEAKKVMKTVSDTTDNIVKDVKTPLQELEGH